MFVGLSILLGIILYIVLAGATHGYGKYKWPPTIERQYIGYCYVNVDVNESKRLWATYCWPFYWIFIWPFTKTNEVTFSRIEKEAARQIVKNKTRIADLAATRAQLEASNAELEKAEVELEKEMAML